MGVGPTWRQSAWSRPLRATIGERVAKSLAPGSAARPEKATILERDGVSISIAAPAAAEDDLMDALEAAGSAQSIDDPASSFQHRYDRWI
jgi:hypothetical protein